MWAKPHGPHEDLLTIVKRRKLQWCGHVSRSSRLAKTILQGAVKGEIRQGRQRKRWEDNIRERTGLEFAKSHGAMENRGKWRKLVAKLSVVPQRPSRLRIGDDDDDDKSHETVSITHNFSRERRAEVDRTEVRLPTSLACALPLGHTGPPSDTFSANWRFILRCPCSGCRSRVPLALSNVTFV